MKVARFHKFGGPEVLVHEEVPKLVRNPGRRWCACAQWASTMSISTTARARRAFRSLSRTSSAANSRARSPA